MLRVEKLLKKLPAGSAAVNPLEKQKKPAVLQISIEKPYMTQSIIARV